MVRSRIGVAFGIAAVSHVHHILAPGGAPAAGHVAHAVAPQQVHSCLVTETAASSEEVDLDPFVGLVDAPALGPADARDDLLGRALRGYVPIRKEFVQKFVRPAASVNRGSTLATLVTSRGQRALDALLLLYALQPVLPGSPLPMATWARILSTRTRCTPNGASKTFSLLEQLHLVAKTGDGRTPIIDPLREDGSDRPWTRPGLEEEEGPGYFTLPHDYWTDGYCDKLALPGKAMLLIMLAETQDPTGKLTFKMAAERAPDWYGISERTAERGYTQLSGVGLLQVRRVKVPDARHPAGRREEYHRALASPFSTSDRARLQRKAKKAVARRSGRGTTRSASTADLVGDPLGASLLTEEAAQ